MKRYMVMMLFLVSIGAAYAQNPAYTAQMDSLLQTTSVRRFNGVVLISQNGIPRYVKAYGYANFKTKVLLTLQSRFSSMSIAKQVTAVLVLREVEQGRLNLQVPIKTYLPDLPYAWADKITAHTLLNHTSGLDAERLDVPLVAEPGNTFKYSNVGYSLLGKIVEHTSGKSYKALVTALFDACGMVHSGYPDAARQKQLVKGHTVHKNGSWHMNPNVRFSRDQIAGSHLVFVAEDLAKWNDCLHNGKLLTPKMYSRMVSYSVTNAHPVFGPRPIGYGYGLRINDLDAIKEIGHTGFHPGEGFTAVNLYYPQAHISVVVMENQGNEDFGIAYYFEQEIRKMILHAMAANHQ